LTQGLSSSVSFLLGGKNLVANNVENAFLTGFGDGTLRIASRFQAVNAGAGSDKLLGGILKPTVVVPPPVVQPVVPPVVQPVVPPVVQPVVPAPESAVEPAAVPAAPAPAPESAVEPAAVLAAPAPAPESAVEPAPVPAAPALAIAVEPAASNPNSVSVPEPATLAGLGLVSGVMAMLRRRKVSKSA
jgi:hypothetical protein